MVEHVQVHPDITGPDTAEAEGPGPYQRGLVIGALGYFLGVATGLALVATLVAAVAFDVIPILAVPLMARRRRTFQVLCWVALGVTLPLAVALRPYAGLAILPTAPLLVLAALPGPPRLIGLRRWLGTPHLAVWTAVVAAAGAYAILLVEALAGAL